MQFPMLWPGNQGRGKANMTMNNIEHNILLKSEFVDMLMEGII